MAIDFESNRRDAERLMARFRESTLPHFIAGKAEPGSSGQRFQSLSPVDGRQC